jgi:hypothetical protein
MEIIMLSFFLFLSFFFFFSRGGGRAYRGCVLHSFFIFNKGGGGKKTAPRRCCLDSVIHEIFLTRFTHILYRPSRPPRRRSGRAVCGGGCSSRRTPRAGTRGRSGDCSACAAGRATASCCTTASAASTARYGGLHHLSSPCCINSFLFLFLFLFAVDIVCVFFFLPFPQHPLTQQLFIDTFFFFFFLHLRIP